MTKPDDTALLNQVLDQMDAECPVCGYQLRGLNGDLCPECGQALRIQIGLVEPRQGAYVGGIVGLAFGVGFASLVLIWASWMVISRQGGPDLSDIIPLGAQLVIEGPLLILWIRARGWLRQRPPEARWILAALTFVLTLLLSSVFFATVR